MRFPEPVFRWALVASALLSLALTPLVRRAALALGVLDLPDQRKVHTTPVPRLGGVAVAAALAIALLAAFAASPALRTALLAGGGVVRWAALGAAALVVLVVGALDDWRGLPATLKLGLEIAAAGAVVLVAQAPVAIALGPHTVPLPLGWVGPLVGVLWIVTLTNAVNMMDVADGVAGGIGLVCALALGLAALGLDRVVATAVLLGLAGALLGFLPHNFRSPRIFLGDSGSLLVGFLLGSASLVGLERDGAWLAVPALLAVAVPLAECGLTVTRRVLRALAVVRPGSSRERFLLQRGRAGLFIPDRRHVPHRLLELGFPAWTMVAVLLVCAGVTGALGLAAVERPAVGLLGALLVFAAIVYVAPRWLYEELRLLDRGAFLPLLESRIFRRRSIHVAYDGVAVAVSFLASWALAGGGGDWEAAIAETAVVVTATLAGFKLAGLYRGSYRHAGLAEAARALRAVGVGGLFGLAAIAVPGVPVSLTQLLLHLYLMLTLVAGARFAFRVLEYVYQRGQPEGRRALIVGTDRVGRDALAEMLSRPELGLRPVGFVEDDVGGRDRDFQGYPVYPDGPRLHDLVRSLGVTDLVVPGTALAPGRLAELGALCRAQGARLVHFDVRWDVAEARPPAEATS